jgi:putative ABC transport system permease protein
MIWQTLVMAVRQVVRNLMRSMLTTLGILIGVAAVIAMVALGRGATARVTQELQALGKNLLILVPGTAAHGAQTSVGTAHPFTLEDVRAARDVPGVAAVAPTSSLGTVAIVGNARWRTAITGSDAAYLQALSWELAGGRAFNDAELRQGSAVCLLGETVRHELFGDQSAVDASVRMGNVSYHVIGTLRAKGQSMFGQDQDNFVIIPLRTFQRRVAGNDYVGFLFVSARDGVATETVKRDLEALFRERRHIHPGDEDDFYVRDMKEVAAMVGGITGTMTSLLAAIAAVSLLVGGIGIMNIMLVAVTERTREIGIRLAIGARAREVLLQFLVEAIVLSAVGGVTGIAIGLGGSYLVAHKLGLPFIVDEGVVAIAFGFSALVGIVFGFFPARKAARLQPIDALRYE